MSCPPLETNALYLLSVKLIFNSVSYSLAPVHLQVIVLDKHVGALNTGRTVKIFEREIFFLLCYFYLPVLHNQANSTKILDLK